MSDSMAVADGLSAVQARISQLQAMLAWRAPSVSGTGASTAAAGGGTSSADFAAALQSAMGSAAVADGSGTSGTSGASTDPLAALTSLGSNSALGAGAALGSGAAGSAALLKALTGTGGGANLGTTIGTAVGSAIGTLLGGPAAGFASTAGPGSPSGIGGATGSATGAGGAIPGTGSAATGATPGADLGAQAVELAKQYTGVPYRWGGDNPETGVDCSGLTQSVYSSLGVTLPRVAADQAKSGTAVESLAAAQPGDLVFFGSPAHHVGIYVGNGKMIDAPHTGSSVGIHPVWGTPSAIRRPSLDPAPSRTVATAAVTAAGSPSAAGSLTGPYASLFQAAGAKYGVDPALLSAVAKAESAYNPKAVSSVGAEGLMQLMPSTARSLGVDPYDPASAVDGAARMLSGLIKDFGGRTDLAIAGYNAGSGAVRRYGGVPPYAETQTYVRRVTQYWEDLR